MMNVLEGRWLIPLKRFSDFWISPSLEMDVAGNSIGLAKLATLPESPV